MYVEAGPEKLFAWNTARYMGAAHQFSERTKRILETLHHKPTDFGINRTNWTQPTFPKAYEAITQRDHFQKHPCQNPVARWLQMEKGATSAYKPRSELPRKARAIAECVARSWVRTKCFFFLDEWGPRQVRKRGGKGYRNDHATIPRHQVSGEVYR
jgi:hypothetical protein